MVGRRDRFLAFLAAVAAATLWMIIPAYSQVNTGSIIGTVTDQTGAAVVGTEVTATNELTGFTRTVKSSVDVSFLIPLLPIRDGYRVNVEATGFKVSFVHSGIVLQLNQNTRIDVQMPLRTVAETVDVAASAPLADTYSSAGGDVVERRRIVELPLNGRNVYQLASLLPGVTVSNTRTTIDAGNRSGNFINVNGAIANQLDYQLDGVHFAGSNNNSGLNMPGGCPRAEQISMFFDTSLFRANETDKFGNVGRNGLYDPASSNTDLGLFKNFGIRESMKVQFRAELFNAFNQVSPSNSTNIIISPTFGKITSAGSARVVQFAMKLDW
jgi:hypothetical protein